MDRMRKSIGALSNEWLQDVAIALLSLALVIVLGALGLWYTGNWPGWLPFTLTPALSLEERKAPTLALPANGEGTNLLANGGFEGGFRNVDGVKELYAPNGWEPWWDARAVRPEWKDATLSIDARRVHTGEHAAQWFNNYAVHTGGIYQRVVGLSPGSTLTLSAWVQAFSSGKDDFEHSDGRYRMRVGIDPYGGVDPESADIVWSDGGNAIQPYDAYSVLRIETQARSDRVTVFVWGQAEWALKHNNAYVDDVALTASAGPEPTPGPTPTPCPPCPTPAAGEINYERIRGIVREELDGTGLTGDR